MREGVKAAVDMGFKNLVIEGDNICVIKVLKREWTTPWEIKDNIEGAIKDLKQGTSVQISHCFREANMVDDLLAKMGNRCRVKRVWHNDFSSSIINFC